MQPTVQSLGIDQLTREQRIILVQEIWETIASETTETTPMLSEEQRKELQRRVAEDDADPDDTIPWEQVKSETLGKLES